MTIKRYINTIIVITAISTWLIIPILSNSFKVLNVSLKNKLAVLPIQISNPYRQSDRKNNSPQIKLFPK